MDSILRQGSKGNAVAELQQILQSKGFYSGKIDGDFGVGTANAVLKFQKANGLTTDAIVGLATWKILRNKPTTASPSSTFVTLLVGSKGAAVSQAQQMLKDKGYYQGRIDGDFGVGTRDAVAAFQRSNGLSIDGKVGEQTWQKLQAPAIATAPPVTAPVETVDFIEIVRPSSPEIPSSSPNPVAPANPVSIFIPTVGTTEVANSNTPAPISTNAISLVDAANRYSRARLVNQTTAINNLQNNIAADVLQQFLQRWQVASGQLATSLQEAFSGYNSSQMLNQNLALQWLQAQLLPQTLNQFRQDWANLIAATAPTTPAEPVNTETMPVPTSPTPTLQFLNLTDAIKIYDRTKYPHQVNALEKLQASIPSATMQQFFQRWTLASQQNAISISLLDVFKDYDSQKYPNQITALQWLEKEITAEQLTKFSQDWQAQIAI